MIELKYCPQCGKPTLNWDGEKKWSCESCHFVLFNNVAGAVAVLICFEDEILFTRRNQEPGKGKLDLSGGFVDPKETAEETCARELYEELKLKVEPSHLQYLGSGHNVYLYKNIPYQTLDLFYRLDLKAKEQLTLEISEISEIVWLKAKEIDLDEIAFDSQKKFLKQYFSL